MCLLHKSYGIKYACRVVFFKKIKYKIAISQQCTCPALTIYRLWCHKTSTCTTKRPVTTDLVTGTCTYLSVAHSHVVQFQSNGLRTGGGPPRIPNLQPYPGLTLSACSSKGGNAFISLLPDLLSPSLSLSFSLSLSLSLPRDFWSQSTPSRVPITVSANLQRQDTHRPCLPPPGRHIWVSLWT